MGHWITKFAKPNLGLSQFLVIALVAGLCALAYTGYLDTIREFLNQEHYAVKFGKYSITPYKILSILTTVILIIWITSIATGVAERMIQNMKRVRTANRMILIKIAQILIYFIAFMVGLDVLGIDLTALTVLSGAVGIGLGFGLQKIASNFISGLILVFEKTVRVGDMIELDDGTTGYVRRAGARFTLLETFDAKEIMIPNEDFITSRVINWTFTSNKSRIEIPVGVSYDSDIELAQKLMLEAVREHPLCGKDPEPVCFLREFADNSVNFLLYFFIDDVTKGRYVVQSEVMFSIWKKFKEHNIGIPYPQRDLHIKNLADLKNVLTSRNDDNG